MVFLASMCVFQSPMATELATLAIPASGLSETMADHATQATIRTAMASTDSRPRRPKTPLNSHWRESATASSIRFSRAPISSRSLSASSGLIGLEKPNTPFGWENL